MSKHVVAVVGATGAVGRTMLRVLEERRFPLSRLVPLASASSAGQTVRFAGSDHEVLDLDGFDFAGVEFALFSAGGSVSLEHGPRAAAAGAIVIDNTSAFRMEPDVPLVVPEVNADAIADRPRGIIANPNCSTIQLVVALAPLHRVAPIERLVISTYQSVSGAGQRAIAELERTTGEALAGEPVAAGPVFPVQIGFNCIPQIMSFEADGYTVEEHKLVNETRKILAAPEIRVSATCVRVPVRIGHAEAVNVQLAEALEPSRARELLAAAPGVVVVDDPGAGDYPHQAASAGTDPVYVGRIRRDPSHDRALDLWVVADNLRKGAALNAVQIAEQLI